MEILSKRLIICLLFVNTLKNSDGGVLERIQERKRIRDERLFPFLSPGTGSQFQQQNDYNDYDAGVDENYEDYQDNGYPESRRIGNNDVTYNVPNNPNAITFNENIPNQQTNYKAGQMPNLSQSNRNAFPVNNNMQGVIPSVDYNKNLNTPQPLSSMDLAKAATGVEVSNEDDTISDRFGEGSASFAGVGEKKKGLKVLKPLTKSKFIFQVQPVKPVDERSSGKNIVYYVE